MRNNFLYKAVAILLLTGSIMSCMQEDVVLKDPQKYTRPLNFAGPVANIHFGAKDLLEKIDSTSFFQIDEEGLIHFRYDTAFSAEWEDLIKFDDLTLSVNYDIKPAKAAVPVVFTDTIVANLDPTQQFDSLTIEEALLSLSIVVPTGFTGTWDIEFPEILIATGEAAKFSGNLNVNHSSSIDLTGGKMLFLNENGKSFFTIITTVNVTNMNGNPANTDLGVTVTMGNLLPKTMFGYFGEIDVFKQQQELQIDFFQNMNISDAIQFKDIKLEVSVDNYFGIPLGLFFDSLLFTNELSGESVDVAFNSGANSIEIAPATYSDPVIPSHDTLMVNSTNSNLIDGINIGPTKIYAEVTGKVNPNGNEGQNFVNTDTKIEGGISIDIPFWFKSSLYERTDIIDFDFAKMLDSTEIDYLDSVNLFFVFTNGFPFNIKAQVYFVNSAAEKVDSLFPVDGGEIIWKTGDLDNSGKVTSPGITNVTIHITHDQAKNMYDNNVKFIHLNSKVSTGGTDFVKLFDSYTIDINLSGELVSGEIKY
ncbi:MAG: hypothetical protein WCX31_04845 [Salinivirgaceae bacterium]